MGGSKAFFMVHFVVLRVVEVLALFAHFFTI
jgi:hypothetical protein